MKQIIREQFMPDEDVLLKVQSTNDEELSKMLIETRYQLGLSFKEMSIILDIPERSYRRWEARETEPSGECMLKICKLRAYYPDLFGLLAEPAIKTEDDKAKLWLQEMAQHLNEQNQNLAKEIALSVSNAISEGKITNTINRSHTSKNSTRSNDYNPKVDELINRVSKLEEQLAFIQEKAINSNKYDSKKKKKS